jgi:autotransporter family porin
VTPASRDYCNEIMRFGYDYQRDFGAGLCPQTFSIIGVKSYHDPAWGLLPGNQNGTFPFNRDSTAYALDYYGSYIRGCLEGWAWWLTGRDEPASDLERVDGCVGAWFAGAWQTKPAKEYVARVHKAMADRPWLDRSWASPSAFCSFLRGCPGGG